MRGSILSRAHLRVAPPRLWRVSFGILLLLPLLIACAPDAATDAATDAPYPSSPPSLGKADNFASTTCQGSNSAMEYVEVCGPSASGAGTFCRCISRLVMGTDHLGNLWEQWGFPEGANQTPSWERKSHAEQMLDFAVAKGINLFDTSPIYVEGIENSLGAWLQQKKLRNPGLRLGEPLRPLRQGQRLPAQPGRAGGDQGLPGAVGRCCTARAENGTVPVVAFFDVRCL